MKTAKKKTSMRAIDRGTVYDIAGKLKNLARSIESGEIVCATDAIVVIRCGRDGRDYRTFGFGQGDPAEQHLMASVFASRMLNRRHV